MEKEALKEIMKECSFRERIIIKSFKKVFIKVYHISRTRIINSLL